ncbi:hypothetical protein EVAR_31018_1 [Eumeta japonica]|uniref:Uncharacterized protein n=1 Tax=Eumeta variegata TaxID=151549 RepID=A0A4C1VEP0_EUMVA|nr:hypothetical protein EVAR_31018_1 [Eumeta japonica]
MSELCGRRRERKANTQKSTCVNIRCAEIFQKSECPGQAQVVMAVNREAAAVRHDRLKQKPAGGPEAPYKFVRRFAARTLVNFYSAANE